MVRYVDHSRLFRFFFVTDLIQRVYCNLSFFNAHISASSYQQNFIYYAAFDDRNKIMYQNGQFDYYLRMYTHLSLLEN